MTHSRKLPKVRQNAMNRGDVVIYRFPFQDRPGEKIRPALVVPADTENRRLANKVLAMITGNLVDAGRPTVVRPTRIVIRTQEHVSSRATWLAASKPNVPPRDLIDSSLVQLGTPEAYGTLSKER